MSKYKLCEKVGLTIHSAKLYELIDQYDFCIKATDVEALLTNAPTVYGSALSDKPDWEDKGVYNWHFDGPTTADKYPTSNYTARLLLIEPIAKDTAEDLLRELMQSWNNSNADWGPLIDRVRAFLARKDAK